MAEFHTVTAAPNPNPGPDAQDRLRRVFTILARIVYENDGEPSPQAGNRIAIMHSGEETPSPLRVLVMSRMLVPLRAMPTCAYHGFKGRVEFEDRPLLGTVLDVHLPVAVGESSKCSTNSTTTMVANT